MKTSWSTKKKMRRALKVEVEQLNLLVSTNDDRHSDELKQLELRHGAELKKMQDEMTIFKESVIWREHEKKLNEEVAKRRRWSRRRSWIRERRS